MVGRASGARGRRLAVLAALIWAGPAQAEPEATAAPDGASVRVADLPDAVLAGLGAEAKGIELALEGATSSMALTASVEGRDLVVRPAYPLLPGRAYALRVPGEDGAMRVIAGGAAPEDPPASVEIRLEPAVPEIPANALRIYLTFSQPMAYGGLRGCAVLTDGRGAVVENAFLNLNVELWNADQTRATLLFDPGRVKRGVGPNVGHGAPLQEGAAYAVRVCGALRTADGVPLGEARSFAFRAGPAVRAVLSPEAWTASQPRRGSRDPLVVRFDRVMDAVGARAALQVVQETSAGSIVVDGAAVADGRAWRFTPRRPWRDGSYALEIDPGLEDVAGNTLDFAFDQANARGDGGREPRRLTFWVAAPGG